ncbi:MAG: CPBP family intramembrane metalloprotease [Planctomycetaceae bacterium]|nr:CPBP family intramembrane metalloprotease [Planctomycetaceae bacterium]
MKRPAIWFLIFVLLFPLLQAYFYFDLMADWPPVVQKTAYSCTKVLMLLIPLISLGVIQKERFRLRKFTCRGLWEGTLFGIFVFAGMCLLYDFYFKPGGIIAPGTPVAEAILKKLSAFGMLKPWLFILFGGFVSVIHSGLEEYYWRWFAFGQLCRTVPKLPAMLISGVAFSLHHVIILGTYLGYSTVWTWLFSFGIAVGGAYWCWLYLRKDSIWASWVSHVWIDIAIFVIGYDIIFNQ